MKNYKTAAAAYDIVLRDYFTPDDIYPYYQAALSYGLINEHGRKIDLLSYVMEASPDADFYAEALFELGRSFAVKEDDENVNSRLTDNEFILFLTNPPKTFPCVSSTMKTRLFLYIIFESNTDVF